MAITKLNTFLNGDSDVDNVMTVLDSAFIGHMDISLDSLSSTTHPTIKAGSSFEYNGNLYQLDSDFVFTGGAFFLNTANYYYFNGTTFNLRFESPTWDTAKQGWYHATWGRALNHTIWYDGVSVFYNKRVEMINQSSRPIQAVSDATERTTTSATWVVEPNLSLTINLQSGEIWDLTFLCQSKYVTTTRMYITFEITSGTATLAFKRDDSLILAGVDSRSCLGGHSSTYENRSANMILEGSLTNNVTIQMFWRMNVGTAYVKDRQLIARKIVGNK